MVQERMFMQSKMLSATNLTLHVMIYAMHVLLSGKFLFLGSSEEALQLCGLPQSFAKASEWENFLRGGTGLKVVKDCSQVCVFLILATLSCFIPP